MISCQWNDCHAVLPDEHALGEHVESIHLESPSDFQCHWRGCKRTSSSDVLEVVDSLAFSSKATLIMHIRSHTGDKPFECQFCGKHFARTDALSKHAKICHLSTEPDQDLKKSKEELKYDRNPIELSKLLLEKQQIPLVVLHNDQLSMDGKPLSKEDKTILMDYILEIKAYRHLRKELDYWLSMEQQKLA